MDDFADILKTTSHRQYPFPNKPWKQYQEWHESLFMHWKVQAMQLKPFLPDGVTIDSFNNQAWVSIIAFSVKKLRPRYLPHLPIISNFHEVNFRTYVTRDGIPGIYFISIEAQKLLPVLLARLLVGLPYIKSEISRKEQRYYSRNIERHLKLEATYIPGEPIQARSDLDYWLTERHALYQQNGNILHRIDVHHKPWPLQHLNVDGRIMGYPVIGAPIVSSPDLVHYAKEIKVLVWGRQIVQS